jgi:hypothetical protein
LRATNVGGTACSMQIARQMQERVQRRLSYRRDQKPPWSIPPR